MSGPKSFSVHVFDVKLKKIFSLQSQISQIFKELRKLSVSDKELDINFDCSNFVDKNSNLIKTNLKSFELGYKGTVQQSRYNKIDSKVQSKIKSLEKVLEKINNQKNDFLDKRQDYLSYVSYNKYFKNSHSSFDQFKINLTDYLEENIKKESPKLFENSKEQISKIEPDISKVEFKFGFQKKEEKSKQKITDHINQKEEKVSQIRNEIAKDILAKSFSQEKQKITSIDVNEEKEIQYLISKINDKIDTVENDKLRVKFKNELQKLENSEVLTNLYFYKEFSDKLNQSEQSQNFKEEIKNVIYELNYTKTTDNLLNRKNKILQYAIEILESETIKQYKFEDFKTQSYFFKKENKEILEEEFINKKENEFLKTQLINGLENMNYEVMDDMEVIDFEKQSNFLFKVPNQSNYVNLRIDKNNSIAYNFLIEENKDELSIDKKREKVVEMESTCEEFNELIMDLEKMGLDIKKTKSNNSDINMLLQVPKQYREKIRKAAKERERTKERIVKKRYLDE